MTIKKTKFKTYLQKLFESKKKLREYLSTQKVSQSDYFLGFFSIQNIFI